MITKVTLITKITRLVVSASDVPPGDYKGTWGGYEVEFSTPDGRPYTLSTEIGLRTPFAECVVHVTKDEITVEI